MDSPAFPNPAPPTPRFRCARLGIVGSGRVARAFTLALAPFSDVPPLLYGRTAAHVAEALSILPGVTAAADAAVLRQQCDLIVIAVSDDAIAPVAEALAPVTGPAGPTLILHTSGRSGVAPLEPLARAGALTAAVHPAMTFTGDPAQEVRRMKAAPFAITAIDPAATGRAEAVVAALGGQAFAVAEDRRALYHGALSHASNHLVTLLAGAADALAAAGISRPRALMAPLVRAALENSLAHGFDALSGPLLRGDTGTIADHLAAFAAHQPDVLPAYRAMALATLDRLEGARPADASASAIRAALTAEDPAGR